MATFTHIDRRASAEVSAALIAVVAIPSAPVPVPVGAAPPGLRPTA